MTALLVAGCGSSDAGQAAKADLSQPETLGGQQMADKMGALYDQAIAAGQTKVTVYGITTKSWAALYDRFTQRFPGIKVDSVTIFGPDLVTRVDTEIATKKQVGDMLSGTKTDAIPLLEKAQLEKYTPFTATGLPAEWVDPSKTVYAPSAYIYSIAYNKNLVGEADVPKSFDDLLDPKWKGKVGVIDLTTGPGDTWMMSRRADGSLDEDFARKFAANAPVMLANENEVFTAVATGRVPIGYYCWVRGPVVLKDQPVGFVVPQTDGNYVGEFYRGIFKGAPNPLAAQLLENWAFTPEAQAMLPGQNQQGLMPGAEPIPGLPAFDTLDVIRAPGWDKYQQEQKSVRSWLDKAFNG